MSEFICEVFGTKAEHKMYMVEHSKKDDFICEVCGVNIDYAKHGTLCLEELEIIPKINDDHTVTQRFITVRAQVLCNKHHVQPRKYFLEDDDWSFAALMVIERLKRELEEKVTDA